VGIFFCLYACTGMDVDKVIPSVCTSFQMHACLVVYADLVTVPKISQVVKFGDL
jgi:hypothetical protein